MNKKSRLPKVAIIMGSKNDSAIMSEAARALKEFNISFEIKIVSAHRTPKFMYEFADQVQARGIQVVIAGAGGAAHLPGMVASLTDLPVIGVPISVGKLKGLDALLSIAQMPKGVPVASVAVDNAFNAGLLAARILAIHDTKIQKQLHRFKNKKRLMVMKQNKK